MTVVSHPTPPIATSRKPLGYVLRAKSLDAFPQPPRSDDMNDPHPWDHPASAGRFPAFRDGCGFLNPAWYPSMQEAYAVAERIGCDPDDYDVRPIFIDSPAGPFTTAIYALYNVKERQWRTTEDGSTIPPTLMLDTWTDIGQVQAHLHAREDHDEWMIVRVGTLPQMGQPSMLATETTPPPYRTSP